MLQYEQTSKTLHSGRGGGCEVECLPQKHEGQSWIPRSHAFSKIMWWNIPVSGEVTVLGAASFLHFCFNPKLCELSGYIT